MANLLEDLATIAEHLPPSHVNIRADQVPAILAAAIHFVEDGGLAEVLKAEEGVATGVQDYFAKKAQDANDQYLKDHPEAGNAPAGVLSGPSYEELLRRVSQLEQAQSAGTPAPAGIASSPSTQTSPSGPPAAVEPAATPEAAPPATPEEQGIVTDPAGPSKAQQEAELIAQIQSAQAQLSRLEGPPTVTSPDPATPAETPAPAAAPTTDTTPPAA